MRRSGFTMIELIFVIVILGILAAVAIPKLMATRTDAKISAVSQEVQSAIGEIPAYITATGKVEGNMTKMSQVLRTMEGQGKATDSNTSSVSQTGPGGSMTGFDANMTSYAVIGTQDDNGNMENCIGLEVNSTILRVFGNSSSTGAICAGVKERVKDANYTVGGNSVTF